MKYRGDGEKSCVCNLDSSDVNRRMRYFRLLSVFCVYCGLTATDTQRLLVDVDHADDIASKLDTNSVQSSETVGLMTIGANIAAGLMVSVGRQTISFRAREDINGVGLESKSAV